MGLDNISSERLSVLRFPLIVGVVLVHNNHTVVNYASGNLGVEAGSVSLLVRNLVAAGIAGTCVPLFF